VAIFHRIRRAWAGLIDQKPDILLGYSNQIGIDGLAVGVGFSSGGFGMSPITGKFSLSRLLMEGRPAIPSL
jgi:glycine/D-amino acid oxidase-like deaminating enzyme